MSEELALADRRSEVASPPPGSRHMEEQNLLTPASDMLCFLWHNFCWPKLQGRRVTDRDPHWLSGWQMREAEFSGPQV